MTIVNSGSKLHALSVLEWPHPLAMLYVEVPPSPKWNWRPLTVVWPVKNNWDLLRSDPGWCSLYGNLDVKYVFFKLREAVDRVSDVQVRKLVRDKSAKQGWT